MNIGRGATVNELDLIRALKDKRIAGAVLDVTQHEPLERDSPLWLMPNVLLYPHSADNDPLRLERAIDQFTENLWLWKAGMTLKNHVRRDKGY
jgi:phosphoglycerate dehydrogenase-like enzyme